MRRRLLATAFFTCAFATASIAQPTEPSFRQPELTASGRGEIRVAPDYAYVTIGVTTQAQNAVVAAADNAKRFDAILAALHTFGLTDTQLLASRYNLSPSYEYPRNAQPKVNGFSARSTIRAEVHRLDDLGKLIDASIAGGATEIAGVQFLASHTDEARRSAMTEAVKQARADADAMARAAGGTLGRVIALNSGPSSRPSYEAGGNFQLQSVAVASGSGMMVPTAVPPGELIVTALVFGRWEFVGPSR